MGPRPATPPLADHDEDRVVLKAAGVSPESAKGLGHYQGGDGGDIRDRLAQTVGVEADAGPGPVLASSSRRPSPIVPPTDAVRSTGKPAEPLVPCYGLADGLS